MTVPPKKTKRRILLISKSLPPQPTGSAIIVANLATEFSPEEMRVVGMGMHNQPPVAWDEHWASIAYVGMEAPSNSRGIKWRRRLLFPAMLWRTWRQAKQFKADTVVAIFPHDELLFIGYLVAKGTRAAFYPYFHNTYLEQRQGSAKRFAEWLQPRVFAYAKHVFVMSEGMQELYQENYPRLSCSPLLHSFKEPLPTFQPPPPVGSPFRFVFSGNINPSNTDATVRVCEAIFKIPDAHITFLSGTPKSYLQKLGLIRDNVDYLTVSRDELLQRLSQADVVVLPHGLTGSIAEEEYRTIFPTKTIEYLICGRPILAHTPKGCFLTRFLQKNQCALVIEDPDPEAITEALHRLRNDNALRATLVQNALKTAEPFQAAQVAHVLRSTMDQKESVK